MTDAISRLAATHSASDHRAALLVITEGLTRALKGDTLRGLPNLGTHATPCWGLNLRGPQLDYKIPFPVQADDSAGSLQLVLTESGVPFWVWAVREPRGWFTFARERVTQVDLQPRDADSGVCHPTDRANVITAADVQRLLTCLPSHIDAHLGILKEEQVLATDAERFAKRIADKLGGGQ